MKKYHEQVQLLVSVLPHIAKEECFALKGGTAINLFIRDMPRLSVDIDLQYIYVDSREIAIANIDEALERISASLKRVGIESIIREDAGSCRKIICNNTAASIKIEPNYVVRGCVKPPKLMQNNLKVQEIYGFAAMKILSFGELYGGKICAALDRQHPRDLFDVKYLLSNEGITPNVKQGFIVALLSHNRPPHEILRPNIQNQKEIFAREFLGMTEEAFSYEDHKNVLHQLINELNMSYSDADKEFLVSFFECSPKWNLINIYKLDELPAVKWKMKNLELLKENNGIKFKSQVRNLQNTFGM
ncbi:MAG: nucleotidyl transferase AbiEii/AbiGii toxin family protein [Holosporaceae bacterium]|nr:nucleotidyl transferase AbiEii/AbiGii toxin family protein [Holosporaceae bacterium]